MREKELGMLRPQDTSDSKVRKIIRTPPNKFINFFASAYSILSMETFQYQIGRIREIIQNTTI